MDNLPKRKLNRLKNYDYSRNGCYFITICTHDRKMLFGDIVDGKMILNEYGNIADIEMKNIECHYDNVSIDKYVIMPNHVHIIVAIVGAPLAAPVLTTSNYDNHTDKTSFSNNIQQGCSIKIDNKGTGAASGAPTNSVMPVIIDGDSVRPTIGNIIRGYKSGVSRKCCKNLWQRNYHDHIIRNNDDYAKISNYIEHNPIQWEYDCHNKNSTNYKEWVDDNK